MVFLFKRTLTVVDITRISSLVLQFFTKAAWKSEREVSGAEEERRTNKGILETKTVKELTVIVILESRIAFLGLQKVVPYSSPFKVVMHVP